ncbi:YciI family protein [Rufibacter latericius]|uniref:Transcription initiation protein n=1 Tax=Rufibacter latericius TaxID=2487040 RepID=A0A3M9MT43_9BACT|nr:YciI family protein [Rufibacter latericius]RNI28696.1 transcription initiation protein [Rufibacter latericius]
MKEFALLFRMDITSEDAQPSPEVMQIYMAQWSTWVSKLSNQELLAPGGNHLSREGKVLRPNNEVTDGPYVAQRQSVAGYLLVFAQDLEAACVLAGECPILQGENTSIEVREIAIPGNL